METKKVIRKRMLQLREEQSFKDAEKKSKQIIDSLYQDVHYQNADIIFFYMNYKGEVCTKGAIQNALNQGKIAALPIIIGNRMEFFEIKSINELKPGFFGVPEPVSGNPIDREADILVMPGVAFDERRNRVGYGKGFYDRYLPFNPSKFKIALAFDFQIVKTLEADEHDIKPDIIITERRII